MTLNTSARLGSASLDYLYLDYGDAQNAVEVLNPDGTKHLIAGRSFKAGQIVSNLLCVSQRSNPTRYTVQIGFYQHADIAFPWPSANHSCAPNLLFDTTRMLITATREIRQGDELTYFYPSTEWDMAEPFLCLCRSEQCLQHIRGARHLPPDVLSRYYFNPHIMALLRQGPR
ncbi:MAG: SET domain-containing protein-lysine N-methyltransferase [Candidatus Schekmanbacteria bacterium]|nr:SET domain-containing protein-lysine N-methyltransferase [Candidatus Schekmanbacteria bacterium]